MKLDGRIHREIMLYAEMQYSVLFQKKIFKSRCLEKIVETLLSTIKYIIIIISSSISIIIMFFSI